MSTINMGITKMMLNSTPTGLNAHYINMFQTRGNAFLKSLGILCAAFVAVNVVGVPTPASAQDVDIETCANLRVPETVNLLSLDSTLAKCLNLYQYSGQNLSRFQTSNPDSTVDRILLSKSGVELTLIK